jgi:phospholipase C
MWTYDDWGGFYDHVKPPAVDKFGYGFRAPALLVSAYARHGFVDHTQIDFTSQLKFIEDNWRLQPLASRDRDANGLSSAFDFKAPPRKAKFVSPDYAPAKVVVTGQGVVYLSYGTGLLLGAGVSVGAIVDMRRRQQRRREVAER